jgi:uncharacterized protein YukE
MALDPPSEVVQFLQFIGIDWPAVNEDAVRDFAGHVRDFANNLSSAHQDATATVQDVGNAYSGAAYDAMVAKWADTSTKHMTELVDACNVVATALDVAADAIVAMKGVAIAELVALAASFVADQAAAVVTFGASEAAIPLLELAAKKACEFLEQQAEQYVIGKVIEAAVKPLSATVAQAVEGLVFNNSSGGGSTADAGASFSINPQMVAQQASTLAAHGETVRGHLQTFQQNLSTVNFSS